MTDAHPPSPEPGVEPTPAGEPQAGQDAATGAGQDTGQHAAADASNNAADAALTPEPAEQAPQPQEPAQAAPAEPAVESGPATDPHLAIPAAVANSGAIPVPGAPLPYPQTPDDPRTGPQALSGPHALSGPQALSGPLSYPSAPAPAQPYFPPPAAPGYPGFPPGPGAPPPPMPYPGSPEYRQMYGSNPAPAYPGMLPPAVPYPPRPPRWKSWGLPAAVLLAVAAMLIAVVVAVRGDSTVDPAQGITEASATQAIQTFLNALADQDLDEIARNSLCGLYDQVTDLRGELAVSKLAAQAYDKQFSKTEVTSIDKMVFVSPSNAQVLFTMRTTPGSAVRGTGTGTAERQAIVQLQESDGQILVCSYVMRGGSF